MSNDRDGSDHATGGDRPPAVSLMPLVVLLLLGCAGALAWAMWVPNTEVLRDGDEAQVADADPQLADAPSSGRTVRVAGRVLLEVPVDPPAAIVEVDSGRAEIVEPDEPGTGGAQGLLDPGVGPPDRPPPVTLQPPDPGACTIYAWREATRLADPVTCDEQGRFEVALPESAAGRTAFELLVPGRLRAVVEVEVPDAGRARLATVALGVAQTVSGQVVDARGEPMAGVEIQAMPIPNLGEPEPWRAVSGDDGVFAFDTLPPGPVAMRAAPPGYDPSVVEAIAPQQDVLLTLQALIDLRGRVVGPSDALSVARVRLEGSGIWPAREVPVDREGRFVFTRIPDGVYAIEAYVARNDGAEYASIPLENVTPDLQATLALIPARRIVVDVLDPSAAAVPQARVSVGNSQVGLLAKVATAGADGRAYVGPVVPGSYVARADADGFLPSEAIEVRVDEAELTPVELVLRRPGRIEGVVVDGTGHGIAGATVLVDSDTLFSVGESRARAEVFAGALRTAGSLGVTEGPVPAIPKFSDYAMGAPDVRQVSTGEGGRFSVSGLSPGRYSLQAVDGRFAASTSIAVSIRPGTVRAGIELVLRTGWSLTGRVVDGNGRPVDAAMVEIDDGTAFRSDRRGVFDAGRRRGQVRLVARASGRAAMARVVRVDGPTDVEFRLEDADARLDGRVEDDNGQPIEDARVTVDAIDGLSPSSIAWTDDRGLWSVDGIAAGLYELEMVAAGRLPQVRRIRIGGARSTRVDVELTSGWAVEVVVREFGRRDPIERATVRTAEHRALTDSEGLAVIEQLSGPAAMITVDAPGYATAIVRVDRPAPPGTGDGDRTSVRVELVEGGSMKGRVIDYRGDPVAGARVVVRTTGDGEVLADLTTDARGAWSAGGLPEGAVMVEALPPTDREDELAEVAQDSDVLRGRVTQGVDLRFDRR